MRRFALTLAALLAALPGSATTLERLSMDDLVLKSTAIVRGRVSGCAGEMRKNVIYTRCEVAVSEQWRGKTPSQTSVWIPGGRVAGLRQTFAGAPVLETGQEYVLFLWAGPSGRNQVIGLHQGVFELKPDAKGTVTAQRDATAEPMVDASGNPVSDEPVRFTASELKRRVNEILGRAQ